MVAVPFHPEPVQAQSGQRQVWGLGPRLSPESKTRQQESSAARDQAARDQAARTPTFPVATCETPAMAALASPIERLPTETVHAWTHRYELLRLFRQCQSTNQVSSPPTSRCLINSSIAADMTGLQSCTRHLARSNLERGIGQQQQL